MVTPNLDQCHRRTLLNDTPPGDFHISPSAVPDNAQLTSHSVWSVDAATFLAGSIEIPFQIASTSPQTFSVCPLELKVFFACDPYPFVSRCHHPFHWNCDFSCCFYARLCGAAPRRPSSLATSVLTVYHQLIFPLSDLGCAPIFPSPFT